MQAGPSHVALRKFLTSQEKVLMAVEGAYFVDEERFLDGWGGGGGGGLLTRLRPEGLGDCLRGGGRCVCVCGIWVKGFNSVFLVTVFS